MSILIKEGVGAGTNIWNGGDSSGVTGPGGGGPGSIPPWMGLRLQCPLWKTKDLGTTTGSSVYTVSESYVSGYIVPKLNGISQDTSRFTETDVDAGTFTFDVAPDSGWSITVDYGVYCDEELTYLTPPQQGTGLPASGGSGDVGFGSGQGARVIVGGSSGGNVRFAWTEDVYEASPTWTANITGFPAVNASAVVRLDPFNSGTTAFAAVNNVIYKNTAYRTGGSWSSIYTLPGTGTFQDLQLTIAQPDLVYLLYVDSTIGDLWVDHSHDGGTTWFGAAALTGTNGSGDGSLLVGQHNASIVYVQSPGGATEFKKSSDGAHTFTNGADPGSEPWNMMQSYSGNASDLILYSEHSGDILQSTDGGGTWTSLGDPGLGQVASKRLDHSGISPSNADIFWKVNATTPSLGTNLSSGATYTGYALPGPTVPTPSVGAMLRDAVWFIGAAASGASVALVYTSVAGSFGTWTNRTGDLQSAIFTGVNPVITSIIPDWST